MKKIPTLFERIYENHKVIGITNNIIPGMEWVLNGEGDATVKVDGSCCSIINGELYKRYGAKKGKKPPIGAIPCCEPDSVTKHWPHWVKCNKDNAADKWFITAFENSTYLLADGTYEAIGKHFQGNPYNYINDTLYPHGSDKIDVERTFDGIKEYLSTHNIEGIVSGKMENLNAKLRELTLDLNGLLKKNEKYLRI